MKFSHKEIKDLFAAWFFISLAFAILLSGGLTSFSVSSLIFSFLVSSIVVGVSFLAHEIMHKYLAQKYGLQAEFHAFYNMLFLALLISFFGFIIAAPGAVFIQGRMTKERNGKISLAGPMTNIVFAFIFLLSVLFFQSPIIKMVSSYGLTINSLLALFNMLPVPIFDGRKVYKWNKAVYFLVLLISILLFVFSYVL